MINKPRKTTVTSLKRTLADIRKSLQESVPGFDSKTMVPIEFSRIGTHYRIEKAPVPPTDKLGLKLEKSFNDFMKKIKVDYVGSKLEGTALIHTKNDVFLVEYTNMENRNGEIVNKKTKSMFGVLEPLPE